MILLTSVQTLEFVLDAAPASTQPTYVTDWIDESTSTFNLGAVGSSDGPTNSTTAVTAVASPSAGNVRRVSNFSVYNGDTVAVILTVQMNDNTTVRTIWKGLLIDGDTLTYSDLRGFSVINSSGELRLALTNVGSSGSSSTSVPAHASSHQSGGTDPLSLAAIAGTLSTTAQDAITRLGTIVSGVWNATKIGLLYGGTNADLSATGGAGKVLKQVSAGAAVTVGLVADADLSVTDVTTNNVSITAHGFAPKAPNDATKYLDGTGAYSVPSGGFTDGNTFTPTVSFGGASVGITYSAQVGRYAAAGKHVWFAGKIILTSQGSSTGNVGITLGTLPNVKNTTDYDPPAFLLISNLNATMAQAPVGSIVHNTNVISMYIITGGVATQLNHTDFTNTAVVNFSGHYETN